jgi:hypothetical protein
MPANPVVRSDETVALSPALNPTVQSQGLGKSQPHRQHPDPELLESLMRGELPAAETRWVVRHLLAGCARCSEVTRFYWSLGGRPEE